MELPDAATSALGAFRWPQWPTPMCQYPTGMVPVTDGAAK